MFGLVNKKRIDELQLQLESVRNVRDLFSTTIGDLEIKLKEAKEANQQCSEDYSELKAQYHRDVGNISASLARAEDTIKRLVSIVNTKNSRK